MGKKDKKITGGFLGELTDQHKEILAQYRDYVNTTEVKDDP